MAGSFPTDTNTQLARAIKAAIAGAHPEFSYWKNAWTTIRDCILGDYQIKMQMERYLPRMSGMSTEDYDAYLGRAYFYNMTHRTVNGLVGTVFRRNPKFSGIPPKLTDNIKQITKDNLPLDLFAKEVAYEVIAMGRFGVLLDMDQEGQNPPFLAGYIAENIVDWTSKEINGRYVLNRVVLQEVRVQRAMTPQALQATTIAQTYRADYRVLVLEQDQTDPETGEGIGPYIYRQYVYKDLMSPPAPVQFTEIVITPTNLGRNFDFIPFVFFGPLTNGSGIEKSPLLDIALMNISHFQSVAQLEHGRFYTALPIYHIKVDNINDMKGSYSVGPATVWEYTADKPPGITEYNGAGLKYLETALDDKEAHVSAMGGRMLDARPGAVAESDSLIKLKEVNEQSLLLNATTTINFGLTQLLKWWTDWQNEDSSKVAVELNQDFLFSIVGAREFRAFTLMYQEGLIPIEALYELLRKAEVIPEYMDFEEFKTQLNDPKNFPNNPDVKAKQAGFTDAAAQHREKNLADQIDSDETIQEMKDETALEIAGIQQDTALSGQQKQAETVKANAKLQAKMLAASPAKPNPNAATTAKPKAKV